VTGSLHHARGFPTATLLPNGQVLVSGGYNNSSGVLASAELYDPRTGTWTLTGSMHDARAYHTATRLPNGQVLVAGGSFGCGGPCELASAELYDPRTGTWTRAGQMLTCRWSPTATLLPTGAVLVTGGDGLLPPPLALASAELYHPRAGA
jgi:hypothetical protein